MTNAPLISVITPCYNDAEHIADAITSVRAQTYANIEHIIIDDGSTDGSGAVLAEQAVDDRKLSILEQRNQGAAHARNAGLKLAQGSFIAFLDADDYWEPDALRMLMVGIQQQGADLAYCGWQNVGLEGGSGEPFIPPDYAEADLVELLLGGNRWPIHAALTRASIIEQAGRFDETLSSCMDYDLWLRIIPGCRVVHVPYVLAYYRHHGGAQITKNKVVIALNHWRAQKKFIRENPSLIAHMSKRRLRELTLGELLNRAYKAYWSRDIDTARALFRIIMRHGYGRVGDWRYMLPALLPRRTHIKLLLARDGARELNR